MGHGLFDQTSQIPNTDGMITNLANINLVIYTADCMPISFYDPKQKVIWIAHSGWKGTIQDISKNILTTMSEKYGSQPSDIYVSIGPSIWPCCYEVQNPEQIQLFRNKYDNIVVRNEKTYIDLWDSIEQDILKSGISREHYENRQICTACHHTTYASHRKDNPNTTANLTVISMRK